jgi:hypothetical protein
VLGHETGHIEAKHIVKAVEKQQKVGLVAGILGAIIGRGSNANIVGAISNVAFTVWSKGYSRGQEDEADGYGVRFMSELGYDPRAAVTMLSKLGDGPDSAIDKALSDHPPTQERERHVNSIIEADHLLDVARQHGGPKLSADLPSSYYSRTNYDNPNNGDYDAPVYYPPNSDGNGEIDLGAPIQIADTGQSRIIMASAPGIARWAGANVRSNGDSLILRRGNRSIELRNDSTQAIVNGRTVTMRAPAQVYDGTLYAPIGNLAEGVGAQATLDNNGRTVWLSLDDGTRGFIRLP